MFDSSLILHLGDLVPLFPRTIDSGRRDDVLLIVDPGRRTRWFHVESSQSLTTSTAKKTCKKKAKSKPKATAKVTKITVLSDCVPLHGDKPPAPACNPPPHPPPPVDPTPAGKPHAEAEAKEKKKKEYRYFLSGEATVGQERVVSESGVHVLQVG
jgi:hypothetical protein